MPDRAPVVTVRRVRAGEGTAVRALRIEAVSDPAAPLAFLTTRAEELSRDDAFWDDRASTGAAGDRAAQFIAERAGEWVGTATVLVRIGGDPDHRGMAVLRRRADVVGVYVRPAVRGTGVIDALLDASSDWAREQGLAAVTLDVHADNARAQAAYRRCGFTPTGATLTSSLGPELQMRRLL